MGRMSLWMNGILFICGLNSSELVDTKNSMSAWCESSESSGTSMGAMKLSFLLMTVVFGLLSGSCDVLKLNFAV